MRSNATVRAIMGPFGSGKSTMCVIELLRRSREQLPGPDGVRRSRWVVVRNTYQQLRDTSIKTFEDWVPPGIAGDWRHMEKKFTIRIPGDLHEGRPTRVEAEVLFRALDTPDDVRNLLSLELTGAWINEFREIPIEVPINLIGRLRYPSVGSCGVEATWQGIIMDSNPPDEQSPYFHLFENRASPTDILGDSIEVDEDVDFSIEVFKQPSGLSPDAENLEHLPGGRNYYLRMMEMARRTGKDDSWINVHVHGQYGFVVDGRPVYGKQFKESEHVWRRSPLKPDPNRILAVGMDFGLTPAAVLAQMDRWGRWQVFDEVVAEDMAADEFARLLRNKINFDYHGMEAIIYADPAGQQRSQVDKRSVFDVLRAQGFTVVASHQSPQLRIDSVRAALGRKVDGVPCLLINERARTLINGFLGGYRYRRLKVSGERFQEKPEKNMYSHVHDALQYVVAYFYAPVLKDLPPVEFPDTLYGDTAMGYIAPTAAEQVELSVGY